MDTIINKGAQPESKALTILLQLLQGLYYMHSKRIMHRDIKPENIILKGTDSIDIGIVDLGFATREQDYKNLFVRCGTPGYVAPEILNDREYNCKVDIFSAGVVFYMVLTGHMPFKGNSIDEIILSNKKGDISFDFKQYKVEVEGFSKLTSDGPADKDAGQEPKQQNLFAGGPWSSCFQRAAVEESSGIARQL